MVSPFLKSKNARTKIINLKPDTTTLGRQVSGFRFQLPSHSTFVTPVTRLSSLLPRPSTLVFSSFADRDRHSDSRDVCHCHLKQLIQQPERFEVPARIRDRIIAAPVAGVWKGPGWRPIGDLDTEGAAWIGAAIPSSRVFSYVKLLATSIIGGDEAGDHVEASQLQSAEQWEIAAGMIRVDIDKNEVPWILRGSAVECVPLASLSVRGS